ncbi:hypothetical protein EV681_4553 [Advenella incenata]|uniref:Uncharacterized protein n=1 Tax=Advenella incenata TaxID=267800 RepID=A0A4V2FRP1_9BURK|nr:hypothetical protein [Advenella incenata]RZT91199.1 hypothetical protein EV681_4553 [Advenella incenata]
MHPALMAFLGLIAVSAIYIGLKDVVAGNTKFKFSLALSPTAAICLFVAAAATAGLILSIPTNASYLSPKQINEQVDQCWSVNGSPIPIYQTDEPQNVSRIECVQKKPTQESFLTIQEFTDQVEKCKLVGGSPKPIYKDDDPMKVYRIQCVRQKY